VPQALTIVAERAFGQGRGQAPAGSLRRNDQVGCDPDLALPAQNMEQNALAVFGAHASV
jgi:hypothetical protein